MFGVINLVLSLMGQTKFIIDDAGSKKVLNLTTSKVLAVRG